MDVLRAACLHPVRHYGLNVGLLQKGDPADFIVVNNLTDFHVIQTYIKGTLVASNGNSLIQSVKAETINHFEASLTQPKDFSVVELRVWFCIKMAH